MSTVDLSTYKELYITTSFEQLENIEKGIQLLATSAVSKEGVDAVYINAHTLVSKSMLMGYKQVGMLAQQIEKLFFQIKQKNFHLTPEVIAVLNSSVAGLRESLESIKKNNTEIGLSSQIHSLEEIERNIL